jgi:hypothetical protein
MEFPYDWKEILGAIGGFMALGIIGLFVGANVLSVGYKLFLAWLHGADAVDQKGLAISSGAIRG